MQAWWDSLTMLEQFFALVGIPATVILIIQTILLIVGMGSHADADLPDGTDVDAGGADIDGFESDSGNFDVSAYDSNSTDLHGAESSVDPGLTIFSVRGFIAFFTIFGWTGLALLRTGALPTLAIIISVAAGACAMVFIAYCFMWMMRLQERGNLDNRNAIGQHGSVYIRVPAGRKSSGKVNIVLQGTYTELDAVTDEKDDIMPNEAIMVIGLHNQDTLIVSRKKVQTTANDTGSN